jgi:hypothetical protein
MRVPHPFSFFRERVGQHSSHDSTKRPLRDYFHEARARQRDSPRERLVASGRELARASQRCGNLPLMHGGLARGAPWFEEMAAVPVLDAVLVAIGFYAGMNAR